MCGLSSVSHHGERVSSLSWRHLTEMKQALHRSSLPFDTLCLLTGSFILQGASAGVISITRVVFVDFTPFQVYSHIYIVAQ